MCSVRSWWKEEHMPFQDSCHQVLILISFTWILEDLLPSGCHYLIIQGNSLSRYLTILIRWEKNEFLLALFWVWHILIHLTSVICRPFFCNRKSIPLTSLGDIPLSKYVDALVCLYVSVCYQIKKDSKKIFDIALSFFFTQRVWHYCICCACGRGLYIKSTKEAMGFCDWWIHHEWFTVRKVNRLLACYLLLLSIDWSWFISSNQL